MKLSKFTGNNGGFEFSPSAIIYLTIFVDMTGFGIVIPLLPFYVATFQAGSTALGILVTSFALMQFISSPILGRLSDKFGRRPVILFSILTSVISFIIFTFSNSYWMLLISRIIAGLATEVSVAQAYISDITTLKDRTKAMGRIGAANGAGMIIGPAVGGFLGIYGFSIPGIVATALAIINLVLAIFFLPETKIPQEWKESAQIKVGRLNNLINAISKPQMPLILTISFLMSLAFSSFPVVVPLLAMNFFKISSSDLSIFFVYAGLVQIIFQAFLIDRISKKVEDKKVIPIGSSLMALGIFTMALSPNFAIFVLVATLMVSGASLLGAAVPSFISKRINPNEIGTVLGVSQSIMSFAMILGPTISGFVYETAGDMIPFFLSSSLLLIATLLGIKISKSQNWSFSQ